MRWRIVRLFVQRLVLVSTSQQIEDEENGEGDAEKPEKGIANLALFHALPLLDKCVFHNSDG
jgi:hypothetical protein